MQTINSSHLEWEVIKSSYDGSTVYCADGDGFVSLEEYQYDNGDKYWVLADQGEPVADLNDGITPCTLEQALEIAQNYLAATYNSIFQSFRIN